MGQRQGLVIGEAGGPGVPAIMDLYGSGSPASQTNLDATVMNVASCQVGSTYRDYLNAHFYFKTAMPTSAAPNGTWALVV